MSELSPLMRQYWDVKSQYPDALLFFRLGDFYELFDADAHVAARELDITLTGRPEPNYPTGRVPMAGVPFRAAESYLARLLNKGYSVAICEQTGTVGATKGPVERQVTRILTPGTVLESHLLPARENNYLVALVKGDKSSNAYWGLAYVDASCGEFWVTQLHESQVMLELGRLNPKELIVPKRTVKASGDNVVPQEALELPKDAEGQYYTTGRPSMYFQLEPARRRIMEIFSVSTLEGFGCQSMPLAICAAGAALEYLQHTQSTLMPKFTGISTYSVDGHLVLDVNTRKNLELIETVRDRSFQGSLLWALDKTKTAMGSRMLRKWLMEPLYVVPEITDRQDAISQLIENDQRRFDLGQSLSQLSDLERLGVKLTSGTINPKELEAIRVSLESLPALAKQIGKSQSRYLKAFLQLPTELTILSEKIAGAIAPDAPREITEGGIFCSGYNQELDEIRSLLGGGKKWIEDFQKKEQERTGIRSLKVSFNSTFGYFIEITHSNKDAVPADYIRKQTLTNAERYITPELKDYESRILNAQKNQNDLEYKLYLNFRNQLADLGAHVYQVSRHLANLDALTSLAEVAKERNFVRPKVDESLTLNIKNGRHPVLEQILPMGKYVANDTYLNGSSNDHQLIILTGPNMSGKSSLLRQVAHIVLLAQIGSFVPADYAHIGLVDRIFTRIGAVDDLTQGHSTFLVEMSETTQCCLSATNRSLILLDEVGRGTSTYDGVAIAWAVAEYLAQEVQARTIFATHYHELNGLTNFFPQIVNYQVLVQENNGQVEFIRRVVAGGANKSFGVQVAKMAGLPDVVIERAKYLMGQMEKRGAASKILDGPKFRGVSVDESMQLSIFNPNNQKNNIQPPVNVVESSV